MFNSLSVIENALILLVSLSPRLLNFFHDIFLQRQGSLRPNSAIVARPVTTSRSLEILARAQSMSQ